ncbi:hypothetical protein OSC52_17475 [Clostridium pasteurianum]|uniref:hypothetical protein n=1 Tax=Clostridium pasteurianum TaxID=1501 RepID=UPI002260A275|nr:hypothetical protein [Clostridium pasteurianum]UZW13607.1 hypothetical protein OSC52_17475 [Clostridium pasteurianum]
MSIGIKYCGGCNPSYDRKNFLWKIKRLINADFENAQVDKIYDIVIVLCGCNSCCADHNKFKYRFKKILVTCAEDYYEVRKYFN